MKSIIRIILLAIIFCPPAIRGSCQTQAYLNYMQADSAYFPLQYYTGYMFNTNARYVLADTGTPLSNELLIQSFGVLFDTVIDANHYDTGYAANVVGNITIDSLSIIIGHQIDQSFPIHRDTILVQIDSISSFNGYLAPYVYYSDTIYTGNTGLSPGNNWLTPTNLIVRPNYPTGILLKSNKFAVTVSFFGPKTDTLGFLPGFPYSICQQGGSGAIPKETKIGKKFGNLTANSITSGYQYFFGRNDTIPTSAGATNGLYLRCTNPSSTFWYFQDNPISAYITFQNLTGLPDLSQPKFSVSQNIPNPFKDETEINYRLNSISNVQFTVCDLAGRTLAKYNYTQQPAGTFKITVDGTQFRPGIYFYTINVNGNAVTKKMVVAE